MALAAWLLFVLPANIALAVTPDEVLTDPVQEARARELSSELRCMVCQNQSIDDSDAPLAHDLRVLLRERIVAGDSNDEVLDFLVARYGEFILLKPRFSGNTLILWLTPPVVLLIGGAVAFAVLRGRRGKGGDKAPLSPEEEKALQRILSDKS